MTSFEKASKPKVFLVLFTSMKLNSSNFHYIFQRPNYKNLTFDNIFILKFYDFHGYLFFMPLCFNIFTDLT